MTPAFERQAVSWPMGQILLWLGLEGRASLPPALLLALGDVSQPLPQSLPGPDPLVSFHCCCDTAVPCWAGLVPVQSQPVCDLGA